MGPDFFRASGRVLFARDVRRPEAFGHACAPGAAAQTQPKKADFFCLLFIEILDSLELFFSMKQSELVVFEREIFDTK